MIRAPFSYTMASFWKIPIKKTFGHRMEWPVLKVQLGNKGITDTREPVGVTATDKEA